MMAAVVGIGDIWRIPTAEEVEAEERRERERKQQVALYEHAEARRALARQRPPSRFSTRPRTRR